ncbi:MAG: Txe/YoeB family addiction module toxin [Novosphingobium sp.]
MKVVFFPTAWDDYILLSETEERLFVKVNRLIAESRRDPFRGTGKPEALRGNLSGWWSRRIDREHRLVYRVAGSGVTQALEIAQCRFHY